MSVLSVEDFKSVLLDLYVAQREIAELRAEVAALKQPDTSAEGADEGV